MTKEELYRQILKIDKPRKQKEPCMNIKLIFQDLRRQGWPNVNTKVSEHDFYSIISSVNKILSDILVGGHKIFLPYNMGGLEIIKVPSGVSINNDGSIKNTYPVDWFRTIDLWTTNKISREKKVLVRNPTRFVYRVFYDRGHAKYNNKSFFKFYVNRSLKQRVKEKINSGTMVALNLY